MTASPTATTPPLAGLDAPGLPQVAARPLLLAEHGGLHAFLPQGADLAHGTPYLADAEYGVVLAPVQHVPAGQAPFLGQRLQLITRTGARCAAEVVGFEYRAQVWPAEVLGDSADGSSSTLATSAEQASRLWSAAMRKPLAARLALEESDCRGQALVGYVEGTTVEAAVEGELNLELRKAALNAFQQLHDYADNQAAYEREVAQDPDGLWPARWEDDGHELSMQRFDFQEGASLVSVSAPYAGCRGFDLNLWALFELDADGALQLLRVELDTPVYQVLSVTRDGAGELDMVIDEGLGARTLLHGRERLTTAGAEFHGCPC